MPISLNDIFYDVLERGRDQARISGVPAEMANRRVQPLQVLRGVHQAVVDVLMSTERHVLDGFYQTKPLSELNATEEGDYVVYALPDDAARDRPDAGLVKLVTTNGRAVYLTIPADDAQADALIESFKLSVSSRITGDPDAYVVDRRFGVSLLMASEAEGSLVYIAVPDRYTEGMLTSGVIPLGMVFYERLVRLAMAYVLPGAAVPEFGNGVESAGAGTQASPGQPERDGAATQGRPAQAERGGL